MTISLDIAEVRRLYLDELWPSDKIAALMGCSKPTILKAIHDNGIPVRHHNDTKRGRPNHLRKALDDDGIVALYLSDARPSCEEVGRAFGVRGQTIRRRLIERNIPLRCLSATIAGKRSGEANSNWRDDLTSEERAKRRNMAQQAKWREKIYARDSYRCQCCGDAAGRNLNAHHIESHCTNKAARFDVDNGITLCAPCHRAFHSAYGLRDNNRAQLDAFFGIRAKAA